MPGFYVLMLQLVTNAEVEAGIRQAGALQPFLLPYLGLAIVVVTHVPLQPSHPVPYRADVQCDPTARPAVTEAASPCCFNATP